MPTRPARSTAPPQAAPKPCCGPRTCRPASCRTAAWPSRALDRAQALIERAGPGTPDLFRRWFDISLLTDSEDRACAALEANPGIVPNPMTRVFCLAREGRWTTAALTLESGRALGDISEADHALLSRFLDPDLFEGEPPLLPPRQVTPLS
ncbi:hypothetical protein [Mangrovicoccus ximenensis]|uniref:hypothetical protein n=1 Tax=Mangrovicoccus ximenensis TaxID=1911570 RepID=UPI0011AE6AE4|nr:hypothetical protein [Mangrovicoccus ximenensis]